MKARLLSFAGQSRIHVVAFAVVGALLATIWGPASAAAPSAADLSVPAAVLVEARAMPTVLVIHGIVYTSSPSDLKEGKYTAHLRLMSGQDGGMVDEVRITDIRPSADGARVKVLVKLASLPDAFLSALPHAGAGMEAGIDTSDAQWTGAGLQRAGRLNLVLTPQSR